MSGGQQLLQTRFFDPKRYDLGRVGRYKINKKLRLTIPDSVRTLTHEDVLSTLDYLINLELDVRKLTFNLHGNGLRELLFRGEQDGCCKWVMFCLLRGEFLFLADVFDQVAEAGEKDERGI